MDQEHTFDEIVDQSYHIEFVFILIKSAHMDVKNNFNIKEGDK